MIQISDSAAAAAATGVQEEGVDLVPSRDDFPYVVDLQNKNRISVGFLPTVAIREYFDRSQIWVARENGDPCGYLLFGSHRHVRPVYDMGTMKIIQACVQYDARRVAHATRLVQALELKAVQDGYERIALWCAEDLEANVFWRSMGFSNCGTRIGGTSRKKPRIHNRWIKALPDPPQMQLFS